MNQLKQHFIRNRWYYLLLMVFAAFACAVNLPFTLEDYINYDSSYQYALNQHDLAGIWELIPADYSPPLYAFYLKFMMVFFGDSLLGMRLASLPFLIGMEFLALFPIREALGKKTGILCAALFALSSLNLVLLPEIRPTIMGYFLVSAMEVYAYLAYFKGKRYSYICLTMFAVLAMYTHNVAMIAAFGTYLVLLGFSLAQKDFRKFRYFLISGCICAVLYVPWLTVVMHQLNNVQNHYWSNEINSFVMTIEWSALKTISDFGQNYLQDLIYLFVRAAAMLYILCRLNLRNFRSCKKLSEISLFRWNEHAEKYIKAFFLLALYFVPMAVFMLLTKIIYSFAAERYFYMFSGVALLLAAAAMIRMGQKLLPILTAVLFAVNAGIARWNMAEKLRKSDFLDMVAHIREAHPDGEIAFVHTHEWSIGMASYYFPDAKHYIVDETWTVLTTFDVFNIDLIPIGSVDRIGEYTDQFYVFADSFPDQDYMISWELSEDEEHYQYEKIGQYYECYSYMNTWSLAEVTVK